jgi:transmembrane sensor
MDTNKEKIKRFTSDKFSLNDYLAVSSWFKKEESQRKLKQYLEEDWHRTENTGNTQGSLNRILDKLHHQINLTQEGSSSRFYRLFSRVAAILLIPALLTIVVLGWLTVSGPAQVEAWAEIHSPIGTRTQFQLPDGTTGWLNSGSSIKYPVSFNDRRVEISGEAWFDVVHRKSDEFHVITPYFDVRVLGTRFNVISYDHEKTAEVILEQGKVQILGKDQSVQGELVPDQHLVYDKSARKAIVTSIDSKTYTSWKAGWLIFKNEPMTEIARRLERKYNAEIVLHGDSLKSSVFRATFQDESLDEICRLLSTVAPIRYSIHEREKQPDDTFTKSKVEMWLKN